MLLSLIRSAATSARAVGQSRAFARTTKAFDAATATAPLPAGKPFGAVRGGVFGFLSGAVVAGASVYYYVLKEYRVANEMLTDDIYALQAATSKLNNYITELEAKVDQLQKKK